MAAANAATAIALHGDQCPASYLWVMISPDQGEVRRGSSGSFRGTLCDTNLNVTGHERVRPTRAYAPRAQIRDLPGMSWLSQHGIFGMKPLNRPSVAKPNLSQEFF